MLRRGSRDLTAKQCNLAGFISIFILALSLPFRRCPVICYGQEFPLLPTGWDVQSRRLLASVYYIACMCLAKADSSPWPPLFICAVHSTPSLACHHAFSFMQW